MGKVLFSALENLASKYPEGVSNLRGKDKGYLKIPRDMKKKKIANKVD